MTDSRQFSLPVYLVSVALILMPLADTFTSLYPWPLFDSRWRFGAVGLVSSSLLIPSLGLLLAYVVSTLNEHHVARRVIGIAALIVAGVCALAIVMFALDAVQTRATVRPEMRTSFHVASITAAVKTVTAAATAFAIGWSAIRHRAVDRGSAAPPLITRTR